MRLHKEVITQKPTWGVCLLNNVPEVKQFCKRRRHSSVCLMPRRFFRSSVVVAVTVIWAFPRFGHLHSQCKTLVIWASPVTLSVNQIAEVIWEGDAYITRVLGMGMPKMRRWPYLCDSAAGPSKIPRRAWVRGSSSLGLLLESVFPEHFILSALK